MPRHGSEDLIRNEEELYEEFFEERGVKRITHYKTPRWSRLTPKVRSQFIREKYVWKLGDSYWKLANEFYGNSKFWWVLAWYNQAPTEGHMKVGNTLYVPRPIAKVLSFFKFGSV
jgi:hypothetical protein